ncbi:MAG: polysaccharide pyruvyl transferase family protein [Lachnospiraceae bacterium]|nr:polysaccharide pyruvyl transferase family protein [Lachnospiraceae bacterium]
MKRIGILTLYKNNKNYGGILQAYALQRFIQSIINDGEECVQISYKISPTPIKEKLRHSLEYRSFGENIKLVLKLLNKYFFRRKHITENQSFQKTFEDFEDRIPHTLKTFTYQTINECACQFTHLITGSDQVWNGGIDLETFCLKFADDKVKRIAYAASSASTKFCKWHDLIFKENLGKFTAISVRERSVVPYFERMSDRKIAVVLDPVFLLSAQEWHNISEKPNISFPYVFCYFLGENKEQRERAKRIAKVNNCKIVTIPQVNGYNKLDVNFGDIQVERVGPREFLGLIENAKGVITDSFHATAFSIIFNKAFWALPRFQNKKGENNNHRVMDILDQFSLSEYYSNSNDILPQIRFDEANMILKARVEESCIFLKDALEGKKC